MPAMVKQDTLAYMILTAFTLRQGDAIQLHPWVHQRGDKCPAPPAQLSSSVSCALCHRLPALPSLLADRSTTVYRVYKRSVPIRQARDSLYRVRCPLWDSWLTLATIAWILSRGKYEQHRNYRFRGLKLSKGATSTCWKC
nr:hypothetical protein CFP56_19435 [Quercus suber]